MLILGLRAFHLNLSWMWELGWSTCWLKGGVRVAGNLGQSPGTIYNGGTKDAHHMTGVFTNQLG